MKIFTSFLAKSGLFQVICCDHHEMYAFTCLNLVPPREKHYQDQPQIYARQTPYQLPYQPLPMKLQANRVAMSGLLANPFSVGQMQYYR